MFEPGSILPQDSNRLSVAVALALAVVLTLALAVGANQASAKHTDNHLPANKVAVSGSSMQVEGPETDFTLLETSMRNAASKSLVLQVTLECSILTSLKTVGDDFSRAESTLDVWVEINGERVPVADNDPGEEGKVTFCNREYQRQTSNFTEDEEATIDDHIATKQAHGFNWMALEPGGGVKHVVVKGRLEEGATPNAEAQVTVGKRTLVVEPVQAAKHETLSN